MFKVKKGGALDGSEVPVMGRSPKKQAKMRMKVVKLEEQRSTTENEARPAGRELVFNPVSE